MKIRRATSSDAEIISSLTVDVQQLHVEAEPEIFVPPASENFSADLHRIWLGRPDNYYFIGELGDEAVGYVFLRHFSREENVYTFAREYIQIDQISVRPAYCGKGFGKLLIEEALRLAEELNISEINLSTWGFNASAQEIFNKMGFETFILQMRLKRD